MKQAECRLYLRNEDRFDLRIGGMWALRFSSRLERVGYVVDVGCQVDKKEQRVKIEGIEDVVPPKPQQVTPTYYWEPDQTIWAGVTTVTTWNTNT